MYLDMLKRVAEDRRFTRNEVASLVDELTDSVSRLEDIKAAFDVAADQTPDSVANDLQILVDNFKSFQTVREHLEGLAEAFSDAETVRDLLNEWESRVSEFEQANETWGDPESYESEDIAAAREELVNAADELVSIASQLWDAHEIDVFGSY